MSLYTPHIIRLRKKNKHNAIPIPIPIPIPIRTASLRIRSLKAQNIFVCDMVQVVVSLIVPCRSPIPK